MDILENFVTALTNRLTVNLDTINEETKDILPLAAICIDTIRKTIISLKTYIIENGFTSEAEEIKFFKSFKPKIYSLLIYYSNVYDLELNRPAGSRETEIDFFKKEQIKLTYFFERHKNSYHYYRTGATYLDQRYFIRSSNNVISSIGVYGLDTDTTFTTGQDYIVSQIMANEMFAKYIENSMSELIIGNNLRTNLNAPSMKLVWTASKASLIELLYGLQSAKVFNNGTITLQHIACFLEKSFQVPLGNFHSTFQEIRDRKKNRTRFLDEMKTKLNDKMDDLDENLR